MDKSVRWLESPWRAIGVAVVWFALSSVLGSALWLIFVPGHTAAGKLLNVAMVQAIVLVAAPILGRVVGDGNIRLGLGDRPVSNWSYIGVLAILIAAYAALLENVRYHVYPSLASQPIDLLRLSVLVGLGPVSEELYFRGWLWTALRKRWRLMPTAAVTSILWLVAHFDPDRLTVPVLLVPVAIMLPLARHLGGSVRSAILLHMLYNLVTETWLWLLKATALL